MLLRRILVILCWKQWDVRNFSFSLFVPFFLFFFSIPSRIALFPCFCSFSPLSNRMLKVSVFLPFFPCSQFFLLCIFLLLSFLLYSYFLVSLVSSCFSFSSSFSFFLCFFIFFLFCFLFFFISFVLFFVCPFLCFFRSPFFSNLFALALIKRPYGCFEQAGATIFPSVFALRFFQENSKSYK